VVDREIATPAAAILAGVIVPNEDFTTCQLDAGTRSSDEILEANDRGHNEDGAGGGHDAAILFQDFRFATKD